MKKIILIVAVIFLSFPAYGQGLSNAYKTVKEKVVEKVDPQACPVYDDTPIGEIIRQPWEIEVGINLLTSPSNGSAQFRTDNFSFEVIHNMSSAFGAYLRYDVLKYEKHKFEGSVYSEKWDNYGIFGGFHLYLSPTIRLFGGAGKIYAKDADGNEPDIKTSIEYGAKYDIPLKGYKFVTAFKVVDGQINKESPKLSEITGDQSYWAISTTLSIPFGYSK